MCFCERGSDERSLVVLVVSERRKSTADVET